MNENINPFEGIKTKIMEAGCDCVDSSWHRFVAFFPYYRIYYIVSGHAIIFLENNKKLELVTGNLYFIPAFAAIKILAVSPQLSARTIFSENKFLTARKSKNFRQRNSLSKLFFHLRHNLHNPSPARTKRLLITCIVVIR